MDTIKAKMRPPGHGLAFPQRHHNYHLNQRIWQKPIVIKSGGGGHVEYLIAKSVDLLGWSIEGRCGNAIRQFQGHPSELKGPRAACLSETTAGASHYNQKYVLITN